ncbi:hypothetical protein [Curtobacterium ammoniigenes]|uniref:hypothetical protein n=1 Tax=Curtobacterium ammoniigenes TaxID=395387 RepID=UPI00083046B2|nr:hypothetical protein [Curtobacterium ammoniigenes]
MSTAIHTPRARPLAIRSGGPLRLIEAAIRREWVRTAIWVLVAGLLALATAGAVPQTFGNPTARRTVVQLVTATPSLLAIRGVPDGTSEGALAFFEVFTYLAIVAGLMSVFLVIRLTRGDEDTGRAELLLAAPVHRRSPLVVGLIVAAAANLILGALVAGGFALGGLPLVGSLLSGAAAAAVGSAYAGVAALAAQIAPSARAANGVAVGVLAGTWALRAIGDAVGTRSADGLRTTSAWPSWLSPIGWGQHVAPFTRASGWPIVLCVAFAVVCAAAACGCRLGATSAQACCENGLVRALDAFARRSRWPGGCTASPCSPGRSGRPCSACSRGASAERPYRRSRAPHPSLGSSLPSCREGRARSSTSSSQRCSASVRCSAPPPASVR